jgi:hypothetical protein
VDDAAGRRSRGEESSDDDEALVTRTGGKNSVAPGIWLLFNHRSNPGACRGAVLGIEDTSECDHASLATTLAATEGGVG